MLASEERALEGQPVTALSIGDGETWAIVSGVELWRTSNGTWQAAGRLADPGLVLRSVLPLPDGVLVGTSRARLFQLRERELVPVVGFDRVSGRDSWYTPWGGPADTRSLARDADGTVYANVHVGGIVRSRDGRWEPTIDVDTDVHQIVAHPEQRGVLFAATAYGLATSRDGGDTWRIDEEGLHGRYCRAVAVADDTIVVTASTGPFTRQAAVYRRPVEGTGAFARCEEGLPEWFSTNVDTYCLAASGGVVALGTDDGTIYRSDDAGTTWERIAERLPAIHAVVVRD